MVKNSFSKGPEGWCSYDYHASVVSGRNVFILTPWEKDGGVDKSGYVWADHTRWSADTPEKPLSILPLIFYRRWVDADPIDLREAEVSVYLRGDGLELDGAQCFFWVYSVSSRWHYTSHPLTLSDGHWASEPLRFTLRSDEALWHRSWSRDPDHPMDLDPLLSQAESYGFSFVGFSREVSGRISMDEFEISPSGSSDGRPGRS